MDQGQLLIHRIPRVGDGAVPVGFWSINLPLESAWEQRLKNEDHSTFVPPQRFARCSDRLIQQGIVLVSLDDHYMDQNSACDVPCLFQRPEGYVVCSHRTLAQEKSGGKDRVLDRQHPTPCSSPCVFPKGGLDLPALPLYPSTRTN